MFKELKPDEAEFLHEIYSDPNLFYEWITHMEEDFVQQLHN